MKRAMSLDATDMEAKRLLASVDTENIEPKSELKEIRNTKVESWKYVGCGFHKGKSTFNLK